LGSLVEVSGKFLIVSDANYYGKGGEGEERVDWTDPSGNEVLVVKV
jgi:hypothetical protein